MFYCTLFAWEGSHVCSEWVFWSGFFGAIFLCMVIRKLQGGLKYLYIIDFSATTHGQFSAPIWSQWLPWWRRKVHFLRLARLIYTSLSYIAKLLTIIQRNLPNQSVENGPVNTLTLVYLIKWLKSSFYHQGWIFFPEKGNYAENDS